MDDVTIGHLGSNGNQLSIGIERYRAKMVGKAQASEMEQT